MKQLNMNTSEILFRKYEETNIRRLEIEPLIRKRRNCSLQFAAALSVNLNDIGSGAAEMWSSPALPLLEQKNANVTMDQGSLIASIYNLGAIIGYSLFPLFVDRIGRKSTLLLFALPQLISWTLILFAKSVFVLCLARLICGIGYGASFVVEIIYLGEIAEKDIRGLLLFSGKIAYNIGTVMVVTTGAFCSYDTMNFILLLLPLIFLITFIFMPESPHYYLKNNQENNAIKSLSKLRGTNDYNLLQQEINKMKESIIETEQSRQFSWIMLFKKKRYRKALIVTLLLKLTMVFSGFNAITAYTQEIFSYSGFSLAPQYSAIVLEFVVLISIIPTAPLIDYVGRRILILWAGIICSLVLGIMGFFFFLKYYLLFNNLYSISWIPLVTLIIYKIGYFSGLSNASIVIASELFPIEAKSSALALIHITKEILTFFIKLGFKRSVAIFKIYSVFWMYAFFSIFLPLISYFIVPETKGYTLEEIQLLL